MERSQKGKQEEEDSVSSFAHEKIKDEVGEKIVKSRRKSSNMTGCADKELTETKNLNRHFRSKLREVLRDLATSPE